MVLAILPTCPKANRLAKEELVRLATPMAAVRNGMGFGPARPVLLKLLVQVECGPPPQAARAMVRLFAALANSVLNPLLTVLISFRLSCLHSCRPWLPV